MINDNSSGKKWRNDNLKDKDREMIWEREKCRKMREKWRVLTSRKEACMNLDSSFCCFWSTTRWSSAVHEEIIRMYLVLL